MSLWKPVAYVVGKAAVKLHYRYHLDIYALCHKHEPDKAAEMSRKSIPTGIRWAVWRRDNFMCAYCLDKTSYLTLDHVVPLTYGGRTEANNLISCCRKCNSRKNDKHFETFINSEWLRNRIKKVHQRSSTTMGQPLRRSRAVDEMHSRIASATGRTSSSLSIESEDSSGASRTKRTYRDCSLNLKTQKRLKR